MSINKVVYGSDVLIDLSDDTVTPETLAEGIIAHDASGNTIKGTFRGGGVIVSDTAPEGDSTILWVDIANGGIAKYWDGTGWVPIKSVWG